MEACPTPAGCCGLQNEGCGGGGIINVTSIETSRAAPGYAVYAACNAGMGSTSPASAQQLVDASGRHAELGVVAAGVSVEGESVGEWCDNAEKMGEQVVAKAR
jgi:NADP-dependent 3-hydroxy acid dehydrogenase YdfG